MIRNGYTAIPVLDAEQHYIGTVGKGDFLRHILDTGSLHKMEMENHRVGEFVRRDFCPPISIDADESEVVRLHSIKTLFLLWTAETHSAES